MTTALWMLFAAVVAAWPVADPGPARLRLLPPRSRSSAPSDRTRRPGRSPVSGWRRRVSSRHLGVAGPAGAGVVVVAFGARPATAAAVFIALAVSVNRVLAVRRERAGRRDRSRLRTALGLLDAELAAGSTEPAALRAAASAAGTHAAAFGAAASTATRAGDVGAVLARAGPELAGLAAAWRVRTACGAGLGALVAVVAADLAETERRDQEVATAMAGPRASAGILAGLPFVGVGLGIAMGADPVGYLVGTSPGSAVLLAGVALNATGIAWIARMTRPVRPP